jgi:hypothetical protein
MDRYDQPRLFAFVEPHVAVTTINSSPRADAVNVVRI